MTEKRFHSEEKTKNKNYSIMPRAQRFYNETSQQFPGPGMYTPTQKQTNGIKFALTRRSPLFKASDNPAPGSYNIPTSFNKGKSYTISPKLSKSMTKYPGPGEYNVKDVVPKAARAVFGRDRRRDNFLNMELVDIPGPGKYGFHGPLEGPRWKFGSELSRIHRKIEDGPGPGSYEIKPITSNIFIKFPCSKRPSKIEKLPGPGDYNISTSRLPSFALSRADKYQKLSGPLFPGPSDYLITDLNQPITHSSMRMFKNLEKLSRNTLSTLNSIDFPKNS